MNTNSDVKILLTLFCISSCLLLWTTFGFLDLRDDNRRLKTEAVRRGAAVWQVNDAGHVTFAWKDPAHNK